MKIVIISALGNKVLRSCVDSMLETYPLDENDIFVIRERRSREETLNFALDIVGRNEDVLFVGDDITFTQGWFSVINRYYDTADIIGFSTLYPHSEIIQDNGYDLVQIDEMVSLDPRNRGLKQSEIEPFEYRYCDTICGCLMLVKKHVFEHVNSFSSDGKNRWSEFIFTYTAKKNELRVAVLDHYVYHKGSSTKVNPDNRLSSISYMLEKEIWEKIQKKYIDTDNISIKLKRKISPSLQSALEKASKILLYGAGTVSEYLLNNINPDSVTICSGLPEEQGMKFHGKEVVNYREAIKEHYDLIVVTPLHEGQRIYERYIAPGINRNSTSVIAIKLKIDGSIYEYEKKEII